MRKKFYIWLSAILITLFAGYYQRVTGPSYPDKVRTSIGRNKFILELPRSNEGMTNAKISIILPDSSISARLLYRNYLSGQKFTSSDLRRVGARLVATFPFLKPGRKFEYYLELKYGNITKEIRRENPVTLRYRGYVPGIIIIPHIILMLLAMMFSNLTGLMVISGESILKPFAMITFTILLTGGIIFGSIVQKFAFGEYWTGIPFGWDLTDNKTLIAVLSWLLAIILNRQKERPTLYIAASVIMILIFTVPHSLFGTERLTA